MPKSQYTLPSTTQDENPFREKSGLQETEAFLRRHSKVIATPKKRWSKKKICLVSCLVCVLVILLVVCGGMIWVFGRGNLGGNVNKWEQALNSTLIDPNQVVVTGVYKLVTFDDAYEDYLKGMGIPFLIVPIILGASEKLDISINESDPSTPVKMITITDWMTRESEFQFDQEFSMTYGKGSMEGQMYNTCSRPQHNIIHCRSVEREKNWEFESELIFSPGGLINKRSFITKNIVTKKYYQREGSSVLMHPNIRKRDDEDASKELNQDGDGGGDGGGDGINRDFIDEDSDWFEDW